MPANLLVPISSTLIADSAIYFLRTRKGFGVGEAKASQPLTIAIISADNSWTDAWTIYEQLRHKDDC